MIYVQGVAGLTQVSPSLTKEKIIAALGFTPANQNSFYEDDSGALLIADEKGYVIARIDANGFTTTKVAASAIALDGEDLAAKLQALAERVPDIDLSDYYTKEEVDQALENLNIEGPSVNLDDYATKEYVDKALEGIDIDVPEVDISKYDTHIVDEAIHVTEEDKQNWNSKSNFSGNYNDLTNAPHIVNDNEDEVVICDSQGNIILRATAEGINAAAIYANGKRVSFPEYTSEDEGKILRIVDGAPAWVALTPAEEVLF